MNGSGTFVPTCSCFPGVSTAGRPRTSWNWLRLSPLPRPKPRLGIAYELPLIYAGNRDARELIQERLQDVMALEMVDNLRPVLERENLMPTRHKIQDQFLEHVMAHAPGYRKLIDWTDAPIMPTPGAVGEIIQTVSAQQDIEVVGVDIGGATTDVFSVFKNRENAPIFNRTVSANLGMSYSVSNVLAEAGLENVLRWVPFDIEVGDLRNRIKNKMIRPTTIPQTLQELILEQAIAREALRLAFEQHKQLAVELRGVQQQRTISEAFDQAESGQTLVDMLSLDMIVGSGGVLSHAPRRQQAMLMMIDAFEPEGITHLAVDSIFMMPQLGVLAQVNPEAATQVFERGLPHPLRYRDYASRCRQGGGKPVLELKLVSQAPHLSPRISLTASSVSTRYHWVKRRRSNFNLRGDSMSEPENGQGIEAEVMGGVVGLVVDTRGRPLEIPADAQQRVAATHQMAGSLRCLSITYATNLVGAVPNRPFLFSPLARFPNLAS